MHNTDPLRRLYHDRSGRPIAGVVVHDHYGRLLIASAHRHRLVFATTEVTFHAGDLSLSERKRVGTNLNLRWRVYGSNLVASTQAPRVQAPSWGTSEIAETSEVLRPF